MSNALIGKRLAQLRQELAAPGETAWSQVKLAEETGVTPNQIARLEQFNAGQIETFIKVLIFFHERGYNTNWILLADNSDVPKRATGGKGKIVESAQVVNKLGELKELLVKEVDGLSKYFEE